MDFLESSFSENDMSRPENTTAPPTAQEPDRGLIFYLVMVKQSKMTLQGQPLWSRELAEELLIMLQPEFPDRDLYIQPYSAPAAAFADIAGTCERHKDMVVSCRSAEHPGHEYLARMGILAMYDARLDLENDEPVMGVTP
jgi:hypothetical protein